MDEYISDKEQIEMIKKWWRENGKFTIFVIIAALLLSFVWRHWQEIKMKNRMEASLIYEQLLTHQANQQFSESDNDAHNLIMKHKNSPYASLAALILAQNAINSKEFDIAEKKLMWVIDNSKDHEFVQIARLREARILLNKQKYDDALKILNIIEVPSYSPLINEVKGDIFLAKNDKAAARIAYQQALQALPKSAPNHSLLEMKYEQAMS